MYSCVGNLFRFLKVKNGFLLATGCAMVLSFVKVRGCNVSTGLSAVVSSLVDDTFIDIVFPWSAAAIRREL